MLITSIWKLAVSLMSNLRSKLGARWGDTHHTLNTKRTRAARALQAIASDTSEQRCDFDQRHLALFTLLALTLLHWLRKGVQVRVPLLLV